MEEGVGLYGAYSFIQRHREHTQVPGVGGRLSVTSPNEFMITLELI